jgi:hypothetical protein
MQRWIDRIVRELRAVLPGEAVREPLAPPASSNEIVRLDRYGFIESADSVEVSHQNN